jgi:pyridoxamine 5'-phosphate oxidase family protein
MSHFSVKELAYLQSQRLARLATLGKDGAPHVIPLVYTYNPELDTLDITGYNMGNSKKFHDIERDARVAIVIDDVQPPWEPRGIEIRGKAQALTEITDLPASSGGAMIRIVPSQIISWGIDTHPYQRNSRKVGTGAE